VSDRLVSPVPGKARKEISEALYTPSGYLWCAKCHRRPTVADLARDPCRCRRHLRVPAVLPQWRELRDAWNEAHLSQSHRVESISHAAAGAASP
jgi:hypothetical protein